MHAPRFLGQGSLEFIREGIDEISTFVSSMAAQDDVDYAEAGSLVCCSKNRRPPTPPLRVGLWLFCAGRQLLARVNLEPESAPQVERYSPYNAIWRHPETQAILYVGEWLGQCWLGVQVLE